MQAGRQSRPIIYTCSEPNELNPAVSIRGDKTRGSNPRVAVQVQRQRWCAGEAVEKAGRQR